MVFTRVFTSGLFFLLEVFVLLTLIYVPDKAGQM